MTVSTIPPVTPLLKFFDNNGAPLAYGKLFTYATATSTKQATYTDSTGNTPNTNPIILNARGEAAVWIDSSLVYKFVLAPSTDTDPPASPIWTQDPIGSFNITQSTGNFSTITVAGSAQVANVVVTGSSIPANGIYLPATNQMGFATNTTLRGTVDANGFWTFGAPSASGSTVTIKAVGTNNTNTLTLPTAGSLINLARSTDGGLAGFVGSRAGTANFSLYNSGGATAEVSVGAATIGLSTNSAQRVALSSAGLVTINAPDSGQSLLISATAANTTNTLTMFTQGSMINFARSTDGGLTGFVGSRSGTTSTSVYNSGGGTAEMEVDAGTLNLKTNTILRGTCSSSGQWQFYDPYNSINATKNAATMDTGTFTGTLTGCTTSPTGTFRWSRTGNIVSINLDTSLTATSNTTACTVTGVPAAISPARKTAVMCLVGDNSLNVSGRASFESGGATTISLGMGTNFSLTGFTNANTKGFIAGFSITYALD